MDISSSKTKDSIAVNPCSLLVKWVGFKRELAKVKGKNLEKGLFALNLFRNIGLA